MKPVAFHPEAEREIDAAVAYYEAERNGLGLEFQAELEDAVKALRRDPERWPIHGKYGLRKYRLKRFPYNLFYLGLENCLRIAAVAHQERRPRYWLGRNSE